MTTIISGSGNSVASSDTNVVIASPSAPANSAILSNWDYSNLSFSVATQEVTPQGIFFKFDGTEMYIVGSSGDDVNQYTLSSAWNVNSATFTANSSTFTEDATPADLAFSSDGATLFIVGQSNVSVFQYTVATPWNITTATYATKSFSVSAQDATPNGLAFKSDGTKMYVSGTTTDSVFQYSLSSAWDVSTASYDSVSFSVAAQDTTPGGLSFNSTGTQMFVVGSTNDRVYQYNLSSAWNISTASFVGYFFVGFQEITPSGIYVADGQNKVYVVGNNSDFVYQYNTNNYALSILSNNTNFSNNIAINGTLYVNNAIASYGVATFNTTTTVGGTLNAGGAISFTTTTGVINIGTSQTTGVMTFGGTAATGAIILGRSTGAQTIQIGNGATTNGTIKNIGIGAAGVAGSNTTISIGSAVAGAFTSTTMHGNTLFKAAIEETANVIVTGAGANVTFAATNQNILLYAGNATANTTLNIINSANVTLNNSLANGESLSAVVMITNGATPYFINGYQVDGTAVTPRWQGGTAPTSGNANSTDVYVFTVIKTANATYTVLGSQTQFR